jgi:hypothetical protein
MSDGLEPSGSAPLHLCLGSSLPIVVLPEAEGLDMRADWPELKWDRFEPIVLSLRKLVATHLGIEADRGAAGCPA